MSNKLSETIIFVNAFIIGSLFVLDFSELVFTSQTPVMQMSALRFDTQVAP